MIAACCGLPGGASVVELRDRSDLIFTYGNHTCGVNRAGVLRVWSACISERALTAGGGGNNLIIMMYYLYLMSRKITEIMQMIEAA